MRYIFLGLKKGPDHLAFKKDIFPGVPAVAQQGLAAPLQCQDAGLIPGLAQWVKGSGIAAAAAWGTTAALI